MNEHPTTPIPVDAGPAPSSITPATPRRRRMVIPAVVASLALGAVGAGVGYAAVSARQTSPSTSSAQQSAPFGQSMQPSFGGPDGYSGGGYSNAPDPGTTSPYAAAPHGKDSQSMRTQSTDTTAKASGSQLTGLVRIATTLKYAGAKAAGTGMVITADGEVITNHHVVEGATQIKVTVMSTGTTYTARIVGTDAADDVAVLQIVGASGLDTVATDNDGVTTGEAVTAVGDGNGTVDHLSAAGGSVLATNQSITTQSEGTASSEQLTDLIQISSDVVSGYSGGATYDADGEVVGMTTAASSGTSDVIGYAIPISKVLSIANDIENGTKSASYSYGYPAFLGIALGNGTTVQGTYDGTSATEAGIEAGDQITSVAGISTITTTQLRSAIATHSPGDDVKITWTDISGAGHSATVTLGQGPVE
jgi:S1-C subfamily serine protease